MYSTKLVDIKGLTSQEIVPILLLLLITIVIVSQTQGESTISLAEGQAQNNATKDMTDMRKAIMALATVATIGCTALATTSPAQAYWRGGGWGGWGPGLAAGLIGAAVIGGIASSAYAYGPGYGYYGYPGYGYYGGGYVPAYYG